MAEAFIALGGNVGDVRATMTRAIAMLHEDGRVAIKSRSADYRTPPWGVTNQPAFINACIMVETALTPAALLARCQQVERALGRDRTRETRWGPRTIDLDILDYDGVIQDEAGLTLPHPRLFERPFVLIPLAEIAPQRIIHGRRVKDAADAADGTGIERLQA